MIVSSIVAYIVSNRSEVDRTDAKMAGKMGQHVQSRSLRSNSDSHSNSSQATPIRIDMMSDEFTSDFVTAQDGLRLHVRLYGPRNATGVPVVCLPGLARTAADF